MNTGRLLNLLQDISGDENRLSLQTQIRELREFVALAQVENIDKKKQDIADLIEREDVKVKNLNKSNLKILNEVNGDIFIAQNLIQSLDNILLNGGYKVLALLDEFLKSRQEFLDTAESIIEDLEKFGVVPHYQESEYEIGLVLPKEFEDIKDFYPALKVYEEFLSTLSEIAGDSVENKVSVINDGCWEFFVIKGLATAKLVDTVLNKFADFYLKVQKIQKNREELRHLKNENLEKELEIERNKLVDKFLAETIQDLLAKFESNNGRSKAELKSYLDKRLPAIVELLKRGAELEVVVPYLLEKDNSSIPKNQVKKIEEFNQTVAATNHRLSSIKSDEVIKLLGPSKPASKKLPKVKDAKKEKSGDE